MPKHAKRKAVVRKATVADAGGLVNLIEHGEFLVGSRDDLMKEIEAFAAEKNRVGPADPSG